MSSHHPVEGSSIVEFRQVSFKYGDAPLLLKDLMFQVPAGEITCVIGANGSGKSTLARLLAGEASPSSGTVFWRANLTMGVRYQRYEKNLLPWYSGRRNLELAGKGREVKELSSWLDAAGYPQWSERVVRNLSGGQQQILSIILLIGLTPDLLVLDEPFSAIDPTRTPIFWRLLRRWVKEQHTGVVVITHNLEEAVVLADNILMLRRPSLGEYRYWTVRNESDEIRSLSHSSTDQLRQELVQAVYEF